MSRPVPIEEMVRVFKSSYTTSYLFKIYNFSLLTKYQIERVESSVFDLGGHKWKLHVYPNGTNSAHGHASIFLENQNPVNVKLRYQAFIVSQLERKWYPSQNAIYDFPLSSTPITRGFQKLMLVADLKTKGFLLEDCCLFGARLHGFEPGKPGAAESFSLIEKPLNHRVTWMMTSFSSFTPEHVHHSNEFIVGNWKWRIQIHPRGAMGEKDRSFSVYLLGAGFINNVPKTKTFAKFKLRVLDQVKRNHLEKTISDWLGSQANDHRGFADFMPLKKLNEYVVHDKLYVGVDFEVISSSKYC